MIWKKSSKSQNGSACVEWSTDHTPGNHAVRDSKDPSGPVIVFTPEGWQTFIDGVKLSQFDL